MWYSVNLCYLDPYSTNMDENIPLCMGDVCTYSGFDIPFQGLL